MTRRAGGKAEEVVTSPTSPQNRKRYNAISIATPIKRFRKSQTKSDITPAQGQQALKDLIFTFVNANADSGIANVNETTEALNAYVERHPGKTSKITALLYLKFISDYAVGIAFPDIPEEQHKFATDYVNALLSEKKIEKKNGETIQSPLIEPMPTKAKEEEAISQMLVSFIGIYGRIYQNTTRAIDTFNESLQDPTRRELFPGPSSSSKAATLTPPKPKPKKLSTWKKLKAKWKKLSRGWKIFAGVVIGLCILGIIIAAVVCPASLFITIPIVGKCAGKIFIMASVGAVAAVTVTGHSIHITFTKIKVNSEDEEQATAQAASADLNNPDDAGKSEERSNEQLSEDEQQAISNAIQSTVRGLLVAGANGFLAELAERETKQLEEVKLLAASSGVNSLRSSPKTLTQSHGSSSMLSPGSRFFVPADDMLRPMREKQANNTLTFPTN